VPIQIEVADLFGTGCFGRDRPGRVENLLDNLHTKRSGICVLVHTSSSLGDFKEREIGEEKVTRVESLEKYPGARSL